MPHGDSTPTEEICGKKGQCELDTRLGDEVLIQAAGGGAIGGLADVHLRPHRRECPADVPGEPLASRRVPAHTNKQFRDGPSYLREIFFLPRSLSSELAPPFGLSLSPLLPPRLSLSLSPVVDPARPPFSHAEPPTHIYKAHTHALLPPLAVSAPSFSSLPSTGCMHESRWTLRKQAASH